MPPRFTHRDRDHHDESGRSDALPIDAIDVDLTLRTVVGGFVPPPRFDAASFDSFAPDPAFPSQARARERLRRFAAELKPVRRLDPRRLTTWLGRAPPDGPRGIYVDGGYGVGKTHLLAATYHAAGVPKRYLSFAELAYTIVQLGLRASVGEFRRYRLICVDEFELDDVANTRMAAAFLRGVTEGIDGAFVLTTSNTLPHDLGQGRFAADQFAREIGEIASRFEVVAVEGDDYRRRPNRPAGLDAGGASAAGRQRAGARVFVTQDDLLAHLSRLHPIHYARLLRAIGVLVLDRLGTIEEQDRALRFVHFVDKAYDLRVGLVATAPADLRDVFAPDYRDGGYARKYQRCLSRLGELLAEADLSLDLSSRRGE